MVTCPKCGYVRQAEDSAPDYQCPSCDIIYAKFDAHRDMGMTIARAKSTGNWSAVPLSMVPEEHLGTALRSMPLTTTPDVPGRRIASTVDIVTAECAFGMNLFRDFFAGMTDVVGGRSGSTQQVLRDARAKVLSELRLEAYRVGGDAVIGVDLDYSEFSGGGKSMLFVVASGTAVKLEQ